MITHSSKEKRKRKHSPTPKSIHAIVSLSLLQEKKKKPSQKKTPLSEMFGKNKHPRRRRRRRRKKRKKRKERQEQMDPIYTEKHISISYSSDTAS
jgi:hypothetical protein